MQDDVLVSVWCMTYNHKRYIKETIGSFLQQKTNFNYEIVIRDDASTDGTSKIVRKFSEKYPEKITAIIEESNYGIHNERARLRQNDLMMKYLKGKYVAFCEGDDLWLDPHKLQIQADYMERHPDCMITGHNCVEINYSNSCIRALSPYSHEKDVTPEEVFNWVNRNMATSSLMIRRELLEPGGFLYDVCMGHAEIVFCAIAQGGIHYFDRIMSCYRSMAKGSWSRKNQENKETYVKQYIFVIINALRYNCFTKGKFSAMLSTYISNIAYQISRRCTLEQLDQWIEDWKQKITGPYTEDLDTGLMEIRRLFRQITDPSYVRDEIRELRKSYKYIVIMGAGEFGKWVAQKLFNCGLDFDGFVVSDGMNEIRGRPLPNKVMRKRIYHLSDLPFPNDEVGVIVGMDLNHYSMVRANLERKGFKYIYPFLVSLE